MLPALLPVANFTPWTGWWLVDESDLLILAAMGGAYLPEYAGRNVLLDLGTVAEQFDTSKIDVGAIDNGRVGGVHYGATTGVNALSVLVKVMRRKATGKATPANAPHAGA